MFRGTNKVIIICLILGPTNLSCSGQHATTSNTDASTQTLSAKEKTQDAQNAEGQLTPEGDSSTRAAKGEAPLIPKGNYIDAYYKLDASSMGTHVCTGKAQIKVNAAVKSGDPILNEPMGILDCGTLGVMDLGKALDMYAIKQGAEFIKIKDNAIFIAKLGNTRFDPPRPILPSFLASDPSKLAKLNLGITTTAYDDKNKTSAQGTTQLRMIAYGEEFRSTELKTTFKDVMTVENLNSGFDNVDKGSAFLFDRVEFKIALNPLAILSIKFKTTAATAILTAKNNQDVVSKELGSIIKNLPTQSGGGVLDKVLGKTVDDATKAFTLDFGLTLIDQKNLGSDNDINRSSSSDDQIKVGSP